MTNDDISSETGRYIREQIARIDQMQARMHEQQRGAPAPGSKDFIPELNPTTFMFALAVALVFLIAGAVCAKLAG